jgi:phytoene dehydrogenase-like protein
VICSPNNYLYASADAEAKLPDGVIRITSLASYSRWTNLSDEDYRLAKLYWYDAAAASAVRFVPDFRRHVMDTDFFTPRTIHRFTGHANGAVYGSVQKRLDGRTHLENLYICGTDQGFVGIIGAIISGVSIANQYLLR